MGIMENYGHKQKAGAWGEAGTYLYIKIKARTWHEGDSSINKNCFIAKLICLFLSFFKSIRCCITKRVFYTNISTDQNLAQTLELC